MHYGLSLFSETAGKTAVTPHTEPTALLDGTGTGP
jgi:hypothetical protein